VLRITACDGGADAAWDAYVARHPRATAYHASAWRRVIEETFGHTTVYLLALDDGRPVGVLPLALMKSLLFGRFLVSLPFVTYGGVLADSEVVERALVDEAIAMARRERAGHLELRHVDDRALGLRTRTHKVSMRLDLPRDADLLWRGFRAKLRSQIRKPQNEGVIARIGGIDLLDPFYQVFATNMRDLGTPVYPRRFFQAVLDAFPDRARIGVATLGDRPVAAGLVLGSRQDLEIPWASSLRPYNFLGGNMLLYWTVLRYACESGYARFDFGRSTPHGGTYRFKEQWGAQPVPLHWQYWLARGDATPDLSPANPRYRAAIRIWRSLPLAVANRLGPMIVSHVP